MTTRARSEAAHFWLSFDDQSSAGPESPTAMVSLDTTTRVHIWARPGTVGPGQHHPTSNPFHRLQNVSLNLVSPQSGLLVDPNSFVVYNPLHPDQRPRFQHVDDSSTGLVVQTDPMPGYAMGVLGIQGFTVYPSTAGGVGGSCLPGESECSATPSGGDAWLFASFDITSAASPGDYELFLQVGENGMNHVGQQNSDIRVRFGVDTVGFSPPLYQPETDKMVTFADDDPDMVLSLRRPGDYNGDGDVNQADYLQWVSLYGSPSRGADGNADGLIDAADYSIWRDRATPPAQPIAVPEPAAGVLLVVLVLALQVPRVAKSSRRSR